MGPTINFRDLIEELRDRLVGHDCETDAVTSAIKNRIRYRLADLLEADPETPIETIVNKLNEKWRRDGLI